HGLSKLLETIQLVSKRVNKDLKVAGVALCLYESGTRLGGEVVEDLENYFSGTRKASPAWSGARLFRTRIRRNIRLAECPSFGQTIFQYAPTSRGAEDYASLAAELQGREPAPLWKVEEERTEIPKVRVEGAPAPAATFLPS
ncbi:MAG TPA: ParA family protein, partial [Isosphaeraceae bacterium]|nr:ParA family protein [Isosphaeraceae bacterium]